MSDLRSQLAASFGAYSIERELGGGGMARVFLAMDKALNRPVVIKVLTPELAANVSTKRFEREIRLAATLQHANIVPVLSAGETDGMPHYTMPYVQGQSLRHRLEREGRLGIGHTVSILRDVGRALAYAHERGVVHRDIKPENILLAGDAAVVSDFGIAKAIAEARHSDGGEERLESTVTQSGSAVGTPAYMSPEQVSADPSVDHRADIYSFGCVAYEMLTGAAPFEGRPVHALFAAHLSESPIPVGEKRPDTPPALARLVTQCLEKDPAKRPQSARDILSGLEGDAAPATGVTRLLQRLTRRQRVVLVAVGVVAITAVLALQWRSWVSARDTVSAVAVVPFVNAGRGTTDEYLADGIADELATALGKIRGVRVVSRSASRYYKSRRDVSASVIGEKLSASHVLQGSLRHVGDRLRVSVQLVSARDNQEVWSSTYDRTTADAFMLQDDIARSILAELRGRLSGGAAAAAPPTSISGTTNPDAWDLYMRGRYLLQRRGVKQASENFAQAIALDSNFARAYGAFAFSVELMTYFEAVRTDSMGKLAIPAARRALALDSTIAEAHSALALAYSHAYDWRAAETEHLRAVRVEPNEAENHIQYGRFLHYTGRPREAEREFEIARRLDPFSAVASGWLGHMYDLRGRDDSALVEARRALEIDSTVAPALFMMVQAQQSAGHRDSARVYAEALWRRVPLPLWRAGASSLFAAMGDSSRALEFLKKWKAQRTPVPQFYTIPAMVYVGLGDSASVFRHLELATANHEPWPTWYSLSEPYFDPFRRSERFRAIVRSVGLDDRIFGSPSGGRLK